MLSLNVEDYKKALFDLSGIQPSDEIMTFYYDESGNCRKFSLTESGFNNTDAMKGDFVLAGVAHEGTHYNLDVQTLYAALDYKEGQKELKFKHLYHNSTDFLSFIGSKRATAFLEWLDRSGLYLHYSALNNLFYSLVDIVESLWETHPQCAMYFREIKSALYDFTIEHQGEVVDILIKYTYPDVKNAPAFCNELCDLIKTYNDDEIFDPGFFLEMFRQMLKTAGKLEKIVFIQDNEPFMLVQEYYLLYLERCEVFSKSTHYFDEEPEVIKRLSDIQLFEDDVPLHNWNFIESHENIFIQISDLIAGLLRKLFMFLDEHSIEQIQSIAVKLTEPQIHNFLTIWSLISKSDSKSKLFIKNAYTPKNVNDRMEKLHLLRGSGKCSTTYMK